MQPQKIQAAVLRNKGGPLKIESLELEKPRDDEVLVRMVATSICGFRAYVPRQRRAGCSYSGKELDTGIK
jgi:Zn-dependent alcohol dehydrogenase